MPSSLALLAGGVEAVCRPGQRQAMCKAAPPPVAACRYISPAGGGWGIIPPEADGLLNAGYEHGQQDGKGRRHNFLQVG